MPFLRWRSALCLREKCCWDCSFFMIACNYFSFKKHKKCPCLSGGKVLFAFVKNVVQIACCMIAVPPPPPPPPVANISGKILQVPFSFQKFLPKPSPPPIFWCFLRSCIYIFQHSAKFSMNYWIMYGVLYLEREVTDNYIRVLPARYCFVIRALAYAYLYMSKNE